jgi:uncharacterized protein
MISAKTPMAALPETETGEAWRGPAAFESRPLRHPVALSWHLGAAALARRLREKRRFIQAVTGPRQVGKTTLVRQVVETHGLRARFASADEPTLRGRDWIEQQWEAARIESRESGKGAAVLVDEIQKIPGWTETVKRLWDEDTQAHGALKVVLLGSAPMLISQGLTESLAGRFELLHLPHWSYSEMQTAFHWSLDQYIFYGGYPGG